MKPLWFCGMTAALWTGGCQSATQPSAKSVSSAWAQRHAPLPPAAANATEHRRTDHSPAPPETIAVVGDAAISRGQLVDLLLRGHGAAVLEQLIALRAAQSLAASKGLEVKESDVDREYELALRRLSNPLPSVASGPLDRSAAERTLDAVLSERNISREEFLTTLRRNAYLRKIVDGELRVTEEQVRAEFDRRFGERVQVRHIQLGSAAEAARVQDRLASGEDFADLARRYSANSAGVAQGGLLDPFSSADEDVPEAFRRAAFALAPGQVSGVVRAGEWHHLIKLERRIPREEKDLDSAREELTRSLRDRLADVNMRARYEQLLRDARLEIRDPVLREAYQRRAARRAP